MYKRTGLQPAHEGFFTTIGKLPAYCQIYESIWIVETDESAEQLYERLIRHFHGNDSLVILECGNESAQWLPTNAQAANWLRTHLNLPASEI